MSTVKSKKLQVGTDATSSNNFTIYQPATPDGTLRIGVGNADSPTEVGRFDSNGYVATNAPAFSYYQSSAQTLSSQTITKLTFTSSEFDTTGGMFASSRFTPTVAGYYMMSGGFEVASSATIFILRLYKNGLPDKALGNTSPSNVTAVFGSAMVYCNGSTDYIELYGYVNTGQNLNSSQSWRTYFQGHLVRAS